MIQIEIDDEDIKSPDWGYRQLAAAMISKAISDAEPRVRMPSAREEWTPADQLSALHWLFVEPQPIGQPYTLINCCEILDLPIDLIRRHTAKHLSDLRMGRKQRKSTKYCPKKYLQAQ